MAFFGVEDGPTVDSGFVVERVNDLAEEFGTVRIAERRAIAAWLRERSESRRKAHAYINADLIDAVASWIERGEHGS